MAEDLLPLVGHNMEGDNDDSSDSEGEYNYFHEHEDPDANSADSDSEDSDNPEHNNHGLAIAAQIKEANSNKSKDKAKKSHSAPNITFDKSLPGAHSYLGNDLEEIRGRTVHDEESWQELQLLSLPGVVLVPGQTLPLHLFQPNTVAMMRRLVDGDKTFGLITSRYLGHDRPSLASIGTTAEILAFKEETDDASGITTVRVKAIGRQRFEVKETRRQIDGLLVGQVKILPERVLPSVLEGATPATYTNVLRAQRENMAGLESTTDHMSILQQWVRSNQTHKKICMEKVKMELTSWNATLREENMPADATEFSFWVAGNLPLDDGLKLHLLKMDSAIQRLRCELSIMQKCTVLCCKECRLQIANKNDVFSMAVEGPLGAYVNPGGFVHETLTVYKARGLSLIGRPSTQNSWFPGYAWTIIQCQNCNHHLGWKFTAAKKKLQPEKFWGLCRSSLMPALQNEDENSESWAPTQ